MHWNHRLVAIKDGDGWLFAVQEVYYNSKGEPTGYNEPFLHDETIEGVYTILNRMQEAMERPCLNSELDFNNPLDV